MKDKVRCNCFTLPRGTCYRNMTFPTRRLTNFIVPKKVGLRHIHNIWK